MPAKLKVSEADPSNVIDARTALEDMREKQYEVVVAAQARLTQLDAALGELARPNGAIIRSADYKHLGITAASKDFMLRRGDGLTTRELADGLIAHGLTTTSDRFIATMFATLKNKPKTFARRDGKWYLTAAVKKGK